MDPRTYRQHAWAQLAKSETFYRRSSREEDALQRSLGLIGGSNDEQDDLEAPGQLLGSWRFALSDSQMLIIS